MDWSTVGTIAIKETRTGFRNRWFVLYTLVFTALIVAFSSIALSSTGVTGQAGFGRTSAGLLNLVLLMVPLIGLTIGAQALVTERQDQSLDYLLAQPVSTSEVFLGKYLGAAVSITIMLVLGFGWAGFIMALRGSSGSLDGFGLLVLLTTLLGLGMLSVGYLISSFTSQTAAALGIAVTIWLGFVIIGDLGIMGSSLVLNFSPSTLLAVTLVNPLDTYKVLSVEVLQTSLEVLGPAGVYASDRFGAQLTPLLLAVEALWIVLPLPGAYWLFKRASIQ